MTNSLTDPLLGDSPNGNGEEYGTLKNGMKKEDSPAWILAELRTQFFLAGPMICVNLLQYSINLVSVMFVGHLGELALASASIATSFAGVIGLSVLLGMASALETLCGQAYGAKQSHLLGIYLQRGIVVLSVSSIPISFVLLNMDSILRAMGQDPEISEYAGLYARYMIPTIFACAFLQPLVKFLQTQSAVLPMALCSLITLVIHTPVCWLLIYKLGVGYRGAAIAGGISQWLNVAFLVIYIKISPDCKKTWNGFSTEAFKGMNDFFKLAIPSAVMICLEYWSFELMVLMSGLLPNPQLEMSSLAISLNTIALMYMIPFGFSAAVSTRVSNELGAGRASAAKKAIVVGFLLALTGGLIMASVAFSARNVWAYVYTSEPEVVDYVASMIPFLAGLTILDACQSVMCGVMRGCGNQAFGAYTNLGAYYVVGVPLAILLAFHYHLNGKGLWMGMIAALGVQASALLIIALYTDWEKQAHIALNRVFTDHIPTDSIPIVQKDESQSTQQE